MTRLLTLEELSERYDFLMLDSSFFIGSQERTKAGSEGDGLFRVLNEQIELLNHTLDNLGNGGGLVTIPEVLDEISASLNYFSREVAVQFHRKSRLGGQVARRKFSEEKKRKRDYVYKIGRKRNRRIRKIVETFRELEKVVSLTGFERVLWGNYECVLSGAISLQNSEYGCAKSKLSDTGKKILLTGAVYSNRGPTAIVSNDRPMMLAWRDFLREGSFDPQELGFYFRETNYDFSPAKSS